MAPKTVATLASMLDSDDSDVDMADVHDENVAPAKKSAPKPRKRKPLSKRLSGGNKKRAPAKQTKRAPLAERSNEQGIADDTEEVDEFAEEQPQAEEVVEEEDEVIEEKPAPKKRGRPAAKRAAAPKKTAKAAEPEDEACGPTPTNPKDRPPGSKVASAAAKRGAKGKKQVEPEPETETEAEPAVSDSQHARMDLDDQNDLQADQIPRSVYKQSNQARAGSRQPQPVARPGHRRAGSASDSERASDPVLRRKLGDMTKEFETLQTRYTRLQEVGIKEAESNFERLKQRSQAQEKAAAELITSLQAELAAARKDAGQNTSLSSQAARAKEQAKASDDKLKASEAQLASLTEKLTLVQSDNKSLQAKLAATRQATHDANGTSRMPGSAIKGKNAANDRETAAQLGLAQLKEDLYGDLTGLIVRSVVKTPEADVFDCIQTGRNGTLHFGLSVDGSDAMASYEDIEIQYTPRLDENRDRDLLDILPDYLVDEITFSRANAPKFYSRICDTLTRKLD